jgi:hypothetical protein
MEKGGDMGGSAASNSSDFVSPLPWLDPRLPDSHY